MLKILVKKQLAEVFKGYFYDAKKNRMRSKIAIAGWIIFFILIMVGMLGGMFTALSLTLCEGLTQAGLGWMYFLLMGGIAILLGAFGSVFNTYAGLYLSRDNDLLLSLPIPARTIITARLVNVWLMGTMYATVVLVPTLAVYWIVSGITPGKVLCGIILYLVVTLIVLLLSCLLGWVVAKISLRLKNKSFITVLISLLFIGGYYFFYFKASDLIRTILLNAQTYGEKLKGTAYGLYLFGRIGEGDLAAAAVFAMTTAVLCVIVWRILSRSFFSIATDTGKTDHVRYVEKTVREKSVFFALLGKEFGRFTSSANYMLNCGLGVLLIPAAGVFLLIKGRVLCEAVGEAFSGKPDCAAVFAGMALCMIASMNDMTVPSVSLEGKSLWVLQSLPVEPQKILHAKMTVQLILTEIPMLFAAGCGSFIVPASAGVKVMVFVMPVTYVVFAAVCSMFVGIRMPLLNWTNELAPIKQSGAVAVILFGSWGVLAAMAGLYLLIGYRIGAASYLVCWSILLAAIAYSLHRWLDTKGAEAFSYL